MRRTEFAQTVTARRRGGGDRDRSGAGADRELYRHHSDTAGGTAHQYRLTGREMRVPQREMGDHAGGAECHGIGARSSGASGISVFAWATAYST